jgi:predicted Zn-dependent peptidase
LVFVEPPPAGAMRITVRVTGADAKAVSAPAGRALGGVFERGPTAVAHPREDRLTVTEKAPAPRIFFGWIGPPADTAEDPALRLGMLLLAHDRFGKIARALVADKHVAVHVRGSIEYWARGSASVIEAVPSVKYDVTAVEQELDRVLAAFIEQGPTAPELVEAKDQLRARLVAERGRAGTTAEPKEVVLARVGKLMASADAATSEEVQSVVKRVFAKEHRVVVTTTPGP